MAAVTWEAQANGKVRVYRDFTSLSAAAAGATALGSVIEAAFAPQPFPTPDTVRELSPATEALIDHDEAADDPEPASAMGLNVATALNPVSQRDEE